MIAECATKESDKRIRILNLIFTYWIGALIYYFVRRPPNAWRNWAPNPGS